MTVVAQPTAIPTCADVAVVVITRDRVASLLRTLAHLHDAGEVDRIVVVDNGSRDATVLEVRRRFPAVEVVEMGRNAGASGRNVGAAAVDRPFVAFCDDDTRWEPGSLGRGVEHLRRCPDLAAVAGRYLLAGGRADPLAAELAASPLGTRPGHPGPSVVGFQAGTAVVRRRAFLGVGGFHPRFGVGGEESLLALDLIDAGWAVCHAPDVRIHHDPSSRDARSERRRARRIARNRLRVAALRRPVGDVARTVGETLRRPRIGWWALAGWASDALWLRRERRTVGRHALAAVRTVEAGPPIGGG
ncbi:glycosyltransferase [Dermatobacter hominis]|uniref:glycosyltransferase n=1 Tax=Dermatobacter hominis TaxID=2884263 RepID=UPI001D106CEA|nr:glycosyltransferase [Dermatobacter hominis]UDY37508.1 glycosyltransferase [Dermatobacter hominis]